MMKVSTDCSNCVHNVVCKSSCNPMVVKERLAKTIVENNITMSNTGMTWEEYLKKMGVDVTFSCPNFMSGSQFTVTRQQVLCEPDSGKVVVCQ